MTGRYRIVFKNNSIHDRWAAHAGGNTRDIEIPGNWWSADWSEQYHFEQLVDSAELRARLSSHDKVRWEAAYKVFDDVTHGVGYFGEGTSHDAEPSLTAVN